MSVADPRPQVRPAWLWPLLVVIIGAFMSILDTTIVNIAIPKIMSTFGVSTDTVEWVITAYMLALGIVVPVTGWLGDKYGYKFLYIVSLGIFTLGSALCGLSPNNSLLIAFRVFQAVGGGMIMPVSMTLLYKIVPRERIGLAMGLWGIAAMAAPALGPTLGGYFVEYVDWRLIFYVNVPVGVVGMILAYYLVPHTGVLSRGRLDLWGFLTIGLSLSTLLLALSEGETWGWRSESIVLLFAVSLLTLVLFVLVELGATEPLLDVRMFAFADFTISNVIIFGAMISMYAGMFYLPLYLQVARGLGAYKVGLVMLPWSLLAAVTMPVSGRLYDRFGIRPLALPGILLLSLSSLFLSRLAYDTGLDTVIQWLYPRGLGIGMLMMPVTAAGLSWIPHEKIGQASAISNIVQRVSGSFGIAILTAYLDAQRVVHARILADTVNNWTRSALLLDRLRLLAGNGYRALMAGLLQRKAFGRAVDDVFMLAMLATLSTAVLTVWLKEKKGAGVRPAMME